MGRRRWSSRGRRFERPFGGLEKGTRSRQGEVVNTALADFFDLKGQNHEELFAGVKHAWEVLPRIGEYLKKNLKNGSKAKLIGAPVIGENVHLGEGTIVEPGVYIRGPAWIGKNCEVRHGAYIRENVIAGDGCVLGNSCEFKNCVLLGGAHVSHFSYVGDSIVGRDVNLGAGVILSNYRLDGQAIKVRVAGTLVETGLRKFGAMVGDKASIGCNAVINPGSLIAKGAKILPGTIWSGVK
jgi:NDP-sugar pyrophosphorylase family protein